MSCEKMTPSKVMFPVFLLSFSFVLFLTFQTWMLVTDRAALNQAYEQQTQPLEQLEKVKVQVNGLAKGLLALDTQGNKNAKDIVGQLKKAGINIQDQSQAPAGQVPPPPPAPRP